MRLQVAIEQYFIFCLGGRDGVRQVVGSDTGFDLAIKQNICLALPAFLGLFSSISYFETLTNVFLGYDVVFAS